MELALSLVDDELHIRLCNEHLVTLFDIVQFLQRP